MHTRPAVVLAGTAIVGLAIDQTTKALVASHVEGRQPVHLIGNAVTIDVLRNSGAAFSFAPTATLAFSLLAVAVAIFIVSRMSRLQSVGWAVSLGLLLAGAVGNLCDRLARAPGFGRGAVVDFIDLQRFGTLNIADICINVGVVLAAVLALRGVPMTARAAHTADGKR